LEAQERDLRAAGVEKVFSEKVSSLAQRVALKACLEFLREGDALLVTRPDRLARSTAELLTIEADLSSRGIMLERQREGIAKAKAEGKYKGRAPTVVRQGDEIRAMVAAGVKPAHVARKLGVARSSVYRILERAEPAT
jgi:DNA invertase Pin-like site-specific DNA recombinase